MYRVQKVLSMIGVLSRRECEKLLFQKKIKINNSIAAIGAKVKIGDKISVNGKIYAVDPEIFKSEIKIIVYHKSAGELVTTKDDRNRKTVFSHLPDINGKWINIGRLDMNTSGLLLFTNNGDIANALMHPSSKIKRVYEVSIKGNMTNEKIILSKKGIDIGKGEIGVFLNIVHTRNELTNTYKVTLATGKNREIRRVFDSLDCKVVKLKRIKYALVELSNLKVNKYRHLTKDETSNIIKYLKKH